MVAVLQQFEEEVEEGVALHHTPCPVLHHHEVKNDVVTDHNVASLADIADVVGVCIAVAGIDVTDIAATVVADTYRIDRLLLLLLLQESPNDDFAVEVVAHRRAVDTVCAVAENVVGGGGGDDGAAAAAAN